MEKWTVVSQVKLWCGVDIDPWIHSLRPHSCNTCKHTGCPFGAPIKTMFAAVQRTVAETCTVYTVETYERWKGLRLWTVPAVRDKWLHSITAQSITDAQMSIFMALHGWKWQKANVISPPKKGPTLNGINYVGNLNDPTLKQILPEPRLIKMFQWGAEWGHISCSSRFQILIALL